MDTKEIINLYDQFVMKTYTRLPVALKKAKGAWVWDNNGKKYLDFFPGWAVSGLGHCHPRVVKAVRGQVKKIIHISNNYFNEWQARLASKIIEHSFDGKVFFCNSGAEANEAAIKLARAFGNPQRNEIITFENSFHGRTLATITATGQPKYQQGFQPLPQGFKTIKFNDISALQGAITEKTVAVMIEPIQGEGGINVADTDYAKHIRKICDDKNIILIFDEVQTGLGRTGQMFCFKNLGVEPDVMTLAKSLGGGLPIGAMAAKKKFADVLKPGMHASTFGGSPIVCAAGLAVFDAIEKEKLLDNANRMGKYLVEKLSALKGKYNFVKEIRGRGVMIGVELSIPGIDIVRNCMDKGLLINCAHDTILRIMPPITVNKGQIDLAINILDNAMKGVK